MNARDELRGIFEELDRDDEVRFVVLGGAGEAFTAGGDIPGFLQRSAWDVSRLADNVAAPERCTKPVSRRSTGTASASGSSSRLPATSGSPPTTSNSASRR